jgi:hypothetical protein
VELLHPITKHMDTAANAVLQAIHRYTIDWFQIKFTSVLPSFGN